MATYKVDDDFNLVPIDDWNNQQAIKHQRNQAAKYIDPDPGDIMPYTQADVMPVVTHQQSVETSTPQARANSFLTRFAGICALYIPLSIGAVWTAAGTVILSYVLGLFGILGAITFVVLTRQDYQHSTAGTERQRTAELGLTLRQQVNNNHDYRMRKLDLDHQYRMEKVA